MTLTVLNPATEEPIAELEQAGVEETDAAVARARQALPEWRRLAPADRSRLLRRLGTLVEEHAEILVRFDNPAPPRMPFMYHCHILEHEDHGMMGQLAVV